MAKAIAIALKKQNILISSIGYILDFMYGTPERSKYTYGFAVGLAILGCAMHMADGSALGVCSVDTLGNI